MSGDYHRLAPSKTMPRRNVTGAPTLLQKLLDHTEGDTETVGNFDTSALVVVIGRKNPFTEIQRERSHVQTLPLPAPHGYTIY